MSVTCTIVKLKLLLMLVTAICGLEIDDIGRYVRNIKMPYGDIAEMTYYSRSVDNYNTGARFYMRYLTHRTTPDTFGYSYTYYHLESYYYSGYGYKLKYPPSYYFPVYLNDTYIYYPPMFIYHHLSNKTFWNGQRAKYICRNDNVFWPLENQTSEFFGEQPPAVVLNHFNHPMYDATAKYWTFRDTVSPPFAYQSLSDFAEMNSMKVKSPNDPSATGYEGRAVRRGSGSTASSLPKSQPSANLQFERRRILTYNYFACPDGIDPAEIYCCGPPTAQFCCGNQKYYYEAEERGSILISIVLFILVGNAMLAVVVLVGWCCLNTICKCFLGARVPRRAVTSTTTAANTIGTAPTVRYTPISDGNRQPAAASSSPRTQPSANRTNNPTPRGSSTPDTNTNANTSYLPPSYDSLLSAPPATQPPSSLGLSSGTGQEYSLLGGSTSVPYSSLMTDSPYISASSYLTAATSTSTSNTNQSSSNAPNF